MPKSILIVSGDISGQKNNTQNFFFLRGLISIFFGEVEKYMPNPYDPYRGHKDYDHIFAVFGV